MKQELEKFIALQNISDYQLTAKIVLINESYQKKYSISLHGTNLVNNQAIIFGYEGTISDIMDTLAHELRISMEKTTSRPNFTLNMKNNLDCVLKVKINGHFTDYCTIRTAQDMKDSIEYVAGIRESGEFGIFYKNKPIYLK